MELKHSWPAQLKVESRQPGKPGQLCPPHEGTSPGATCGQAEMHPQCTLPQALAHPEGATFSK